MARLIINEGDGPRAMELRGPMSLGSNPTCDLVLAHHTTIGTRIDLKPLRFGYRASVIKGALEVNGRVTAMADLEHNDALRIGEVLILYKQPEGESFDPTGSATPAVATPQAAAGEAIELLREDEAAEELSDADVLALAGLEPVEELELLQGDELEELPELEEVEELPELEGLEELGPERHAHETAGLDDALLRARHKRLEALRRVQLAKRGESPEGPDLSAPGALDAVAGLDDDAAATLEGLEWSQGLTDATLPEILDRAREIAEQKAAERAAAARAAKQAAERAAADRAASEAAERVAAERAASEAAEREAADRAARETAEREAAKRADKEGAERAAADSVAKEAAKEGAERADAKRAAKEAAERAAAKRGAKQNAERETAAAGLEELDELEELEVIEELHELEEIEDFELEPVAAEPAPAAQAYRAAVASTSSGTAAVAVIDPSVFAGVNPPRPLPPGGVPFRRPLPPGHRAPAFLPPLHPGRPPA